MDDVSDIGVRAIERGPNSDIVGDRKHWKPGIFDRLDAGFLIVSSGAVLPGYLASRPPNGTRGRITMCECGAVGV